MLNMWILNSDERHLQEVTNRQSYWKRSDLTETSA